MTIFADIDRVLESIEHNVEFTFGDWDRDQGIGSSDISCVCHNVLRDLGTTSDDISDVEWQMIRNGVNNKLNEVLA